MVTGDQTANGEKRSRTRRSSEIMEAACSYRRIDDPGPNRVGRVYPKQSWLGTPNGVVWFHLMVDVCYHHWTCLVNESVDRDKDGLSPNACDQEGL